MAHKKPSLMDFVRLGTMAKELADYARQIGVRPIAEAAGMLEDEARTALAESVKSGADLSVLCAAAAGSPAPSFPAAPTDDGSAVPEGDNQRERKKGTPIRMARLPGAEKAPEKPSESPEGLSPGIRPIDPPGTPPALPAPPPEPDADEEAARKLLSEHNLGIGQAVGGEGSEPPPIV